MKPRHAPRQERPRPTAVARGAAETARISVRREIGAKVPPEDRHRLAQRGRAGDPVGRHQEGGARGQGEAALVLTHAPGREPVLEEEAVDHGHSKLGAGAVFDVHAREIGGHHEVARVERLTVGFGGERPGAAAQREREEQEVSHTRRDLHGSLGVTSRRWPAGCLLPVACCHPPPPNIRRGKAGRLKSG